MCSLLYPLVTFFLLCLCIAYWASTAMYPPADPGLWPRGWLKVPNLPGGDPQPGGKARTWCGNGFFFHVPLWSLNPELRFLNKLLASCPLPTKLSIRSSMTPAAQLLGKPATLR